ncbi:MAG: NADH-quinone oxidoreductase subunit L [Candidatus Eisenbacteria bacterium]|nr:NADH-quinone oxidoreductase subunit L [Candidatus Eisenbacteria bacterium]
MVTTATFQLAWAVLLLPLLGVLLNGVFVRSPKKRVIDIIGCGSVGLSFLFSLILLKQLLTLPPDGRSVELVLYNWIRSGELSSAFGLLIDPLSIVMILIVSGVGFLIHVYSTGYMEGDPGYRRFFVCLNLFIFSMLLLVLSDNFALMFAGWELVGLCSYLLVGFWFEKKSAADAGKKAFIVNRIGDFGFTLGMIAIFYFFGTLNFGEVFKLAGSRFDVGSGIMTAITLLLFVGATGKSAQIPLYVWLPDAMEGPTPVSALIHAATMVTAGVYMVARCHVLYLLSPFSLSVVAVVGGFTALFAATIGLVQNDIKRVLAYSTISQIGYMFLACGVGSFCAGIFHLMTHAFFKAVLFLGAGCVIHALHSEQDVRRMGGLGALLPRTYVSFLSASLAISGIFPFAGFFSKDEILLAAWEKGNFVLWAIGLFTAFLTSFYIFRVFYLTFAGNLRGGSGAEEHVHEAPRSMTFPVLTLGVLSLIGGFVGLPLIEHANVLKNFLSPLFQEPLEAAKPLVHIEVLLMAVSLAAGIAGILIAHRFYVRSPLVPERIKERLKPAYDLAFNKYFVDQIYGAAIVKPLLGMSDFFWKFIDNRVIDGIVNLVGSIIEAFSKLFRVFQSGYVHRYALYMSGGASVLLWYLLTR